MSLTYAVPGWRLNLFDEAALFRPDGVPNKRTIHLGRWTLILAGRSEGFG